MPMSPMSAPEDDSFVDEADNDLEDILNRPARRGKRVIQSVALTLVLAIAVVILFHPTWPQTAAGNSYMPPTSVFITSNLSAGTVIMNGKQHSGQFPILVPVRSGDNVFTAIAPPFHSHVCHFRWPSLESDGNECGASGGASGPAMSVNFALADLPPDLKSQAMQLVATTLKSSLPISHTTVPVGQYYAVSANQLGLVTSARATAPLSATLAYTADATYVFSAGDVASFSTGAFGAGHSQYWIGIVPTALAWHFTQADGTTVGALTISTSSILPLALTYTANGFESVRFAENLTTDFMDESCSDASSSLNALLSTSSSANAWNLMSTSQHGIEGCLAEIEHIGDLATPTPALTREIVYRFGVLLAANQQTHQLFPTLPLAPAAEITAVSS